MGKQQWANTFQEMIYSESGSKSGNTRHWTVLKRIETSAWQEIILCGCCWACNSNRFTCMMSDSHSGSSLEGRLFGAVLLVWFPKQLTFSLLDPHWIRTPLSLEAASSVAAAPAKKGSCPSSWHAISVDTQVLISLSHGHAITNRKRHEKMKKHKTRSLLHLDVKLTLMQFDAYYMLLSFDAAKL